MDLVNYTWMMPIIVIGLLITAGVIYIIAQLIFPERKILNDIAARWDNVSINTPIMISVILVILVSLLIEFLAKN